MSDSKSKQAAKKACLHATSVLDQGLQFLTDRAGIIKAMLEKDTFSQQEIAICKAGLSLLLLQITKNQAEIDLC